MANDSCQELFPFPNEIQLADEEVENVDAPHVIITSTDVGTSQVKDEKVDLWHSSSTNPLAVSEFCATTNKKVLIDGGFSHFSTQP